MQFRIGQRVRRLPRNCICIPAGAEGTIVGELKCWPDSLAGKCGEARYRVLYDGRPSVGHDGAWCSLPENLVPLTDPKADELIAALNKQMSAPVGPVVPVGDEQPALREVLDGYGS